MKKSILATLLVALAASGSALAQQKATPYIGGSVGYAISDVAKDFGDAYYRRVNSSDDSATGYKLYGGVLWGHWGVEVGYYDFGKYKVEGVSNASVADKFSTTAFAISAVGSWPVARNWMLNGKLGIAPAKTKYSCESGCTGIPNVDKSSTGVVLGFGAGWQVSPNVVLRADWEALGGIKAAGYSAPGRLEEAEYSYNMFSIGVEARF